MFRAHITTAVALTATIGLLAGPVQAAPAEDFTTTERHGQALLEKALRQTDSTSISAALLSGGKVVWEGRAGEISVRGQRPSATTTYGIGSVSKILTTMAVMRLVDQGKVSLDAPVVRYLPQFRMASPQYTQITVRMLLNHTAGFPGSDYANGVTYAPVPGYPQQVLRTLSKARLKTTPGANNVYCNDCFTVAGEVVAAVSGQPFEDYVERAIFRPLGMRHSSFQVKPGVSAPVIVDGKKQPMEYTNIAASGGVVSTPRDMLRLAEVFTGDRPGIISASAIAQMGTDQTTTTLKAGPRSNLRYGLGWDDMRYPALADVGLTGWVKGGDISQHHGAFLVVPDRDLAVMVSAAGTGIDSNLLEAVGGQILLRALVDTGYLDRYPAARSTRMPAARGSLPNPRRIAGIYLGSGITMRVTRRSNRAVSLAVYSMGRWQKRPGRFLARGDGRFWSTAVPGQSIRVQQAWGRRYLIIRSLADTGNYFSSLAVGQRVRSLPTTPQWAARQGQKWLLANENPESTAWQVPWLMFDRIPGVTGYLMAYGTLVGYTPFNAAEDPAVGSMFLQVPLGMGRDQYDFDVSSHGGEDVLQVGASVLRQEATVPALTTGSVVIGSRGFAEWRRAQAGQKVLVDGQSHWLTYDADLQATGRGQADPATVSLDKGAYLVVFGEPGTVVTIG